MAIFGFEFYVVFIAQVSLLHKQFSMCFTSLKGKSDVSCAWVGVMFSWGLM